MGLLDWLRGGSKPPPVPSAPAPPTEADVFEALDHVRDAVVAAAAPGLVRSRVARIDRLVRAAVPRLADLGLGSADAYAVVATATNYLPEAVAGYARLPREWADTRPIDEGRTALMILVDQLELLGSTMEKVLDAAIRSDAQALIAHARFLEAKFGAASSGAGLDLASNAAPESGSLVPPTAGGPATSARHSSAPRRPTNSLDL